MNKIITAQLTKPVIDPESLKKGHAFEDYIVTLFNERNFILLEWRSDKTASNGVYPLSCSYPDLEFSNRGRRRRPFAIECKWRASLREGGIYWAEQYQISNYLDYQNYYRIPVFVAIGLGGEPSNPKKLFITPLDHISMYTHVFESHLIPYRRIPGYRIDDAEQLELF